MDKKIFIKKMRSVFCELSKASQKYSEVWLGDADFGGLYYSGDYVLHIKTSHRIESYTDEIRAVLKMLNTKAHDEFKYIWSVTVYDSVDLFHNECQRGPVLIYGEVETY